MEKRYLIVADDFTGSNDTGVQLRRKGINVRVTFDNKHINEHKHSVVIDTESRGMDPKDAYNHTKNTVDGVDFEQFSYVIKKVDSTLRGNVAEEIRAVDELYKPELIIFAPALPDLGRTTKNGVHMLNGVPISETEIAKDPKKPVLEDNLKNILASVYDEKIIHASIEDVGNGMSLDDSRIYTFDAESNEELINIINLTKATNKKVLWVGTAAMADAIMETEIQIKPAMCVCASVSAVTNTQVKEAEAAGVHLVKIPVPEFLTGEIPNADEYVKECIDTLSMGKDLIILSSASYDRNEIDRSVEAGAKKGMVLPEISEYVQELMGSIANKVLQQQSVSGVFLTGGDTAIGFLKLANAEGSEILSEVATGIPLMQIVGGVYDGLKVVTKAGAFGQPDAIIQGMRKLKEIY